MNEIKKQDKSTLWAIFIIGLVIIAAIWLWSANASNPQQSNYQPTSGSGTQANSFNMANVLICDITENSDKSDKRKTFQLNDLYTDTPKLLTTQEGVIGTFPMEKVSETSSLLVIQFVSPTTGSTDTITLYKGTGRFEREEKGTFTGDFSFSSSGQCK